MKPIGYVVQQHGVRLSRPVKAYDKWVNRMPEEYARNLLGDNAGPYPATPALDKVHALATVKHFRSLVPMAQEARKPIFHLTTADGAIGSHAAAANDARRDFKQLANRIAQMVIPEAMAAGKPPYPDRYAYLRLAQPLTHVASAASGKPSPPPQSFYLLVSSCKMLLNTLPFQSGGATYQEKLQWPDSRPSRSAAPATSCPSTYCAANTSSM